MMSAQIHVAPGSKAYPLPLLLDALVLVGAIFTVLMVQDGIDGVAAMVWLLFLAPACLVMMAEGAGIPIPRPPSLLLAAVALCFLIPILMSMDRFRVAEPLLEAILLLLLLRIVDRKGPREWAQIALIFLATLVVYALLTLERLYLTVAVVLSYCSSLILMLAAWLRREPDARISLADIRSLLARALGIFAMMLPLCLLLFFVAPRFGTPFLTRGAFGNRGLTGFTGQLRLGTVASLQEDDRLAFRAEAPDIAPREPYWRGAVLAHFNGVLWDADLYSRRRREVPASDGPFIHQTVYLEPGMERWLFTLDAPVSVQGERVSRLGNGTFMRWGYAAFRYEAVSVLAPFSCELSQREANMYLAIPAGWSPAIRRLTEDVTRDASTDREAMDAIVSWLLGGEYRWSLTGLPTGPDALERFLLTARQGTCEYFASAAGVMLRMAGIPTRLVAGYKGGTYNTSVGHWTVRGRDAHVWVEAWDSASKTWIRLDPTPPDLTGGADGAYEVGFLWELWDFLDLQWNRWFVSYDGGEQRAWAAALRDLLSGRSTLSADDLAKAGRGALGAAMPVALVLLAVAGAWAAWGHLRRDPRLVLRDRFDRILARHGFDRHENEGLEEHAQRLPEPSRTVASRIAAGLNAALYSGRGMGPELREQLLRDLAALSETNVPRP